LTLASHDADTFNRWQALQTLATQHLLRSTALVRKGHAPLAHDGLSSAYLHCLDQAMDDPAFAALALALPHEQDIARAAGTEIDPDAIHTARQELKQSVRCHCHKIFESSSENLRVLL